MTDALIGQILEQDHSKKKTSPRIRPGFKYEQAKFSKSSVLGYDQPRLRPALK